MNKNGLLKNMHTKINTTHCNLLPLLLLFLLIPATGWSTNDKRQQEQMEQLLSMDFKELTKIHLTSAARKEQTLLDTTAAVTVIDQETIRRSGLMSIPELLRLVPGLEVTQINSSNWAITSRGFNAQFSNKLLVLMDGRTLYTPLFAGVNWNLQDILLENIERIEIIRGPGGTLWGANAVNGVINIITKKAIDTQGGLITMGGGNLKKMHAGLRYGDELNKNMAYRFYAKGFEQADFNTSNGTGANDAWDARQGGMRLDWQINQHNDLTIQGDLYSISEDSPAAKKNGGNLLLRWNRTLQDDSNFSAQLFYDHTVKSSIEESSIYDLDWQHSFSLSNQHEIIWGLGYRQVNISLENSPLISWNPPSRSDQTFSLFVQDEIPLQGDTLKLTIGSKVEHNDYSGLEYQPSARLLWHVNEQNMVWSAISRAVRTPSYTDTGFLLNTPLSPATNLSIRGNPDVTSETVWAYEVGYRTQPMAQLSLDIAAFYNQYNHLVSTENLPVEGNFLTGFTFPQTFANKATATTYGLETALDWQAMPHWKIRTSHTYLKMNLALTADSTDTSTIPTDDDIPRHQWQLHSYWDLPHNLELDSALYYTARLPHLDIPASARVDLRLGWNPTKTVQLSLSGHNLLDNQHPEFQGTSIKAYEIPRSFFAKINWSF